VTRFYDSLCSCFRLNQICTLVYLIKFLRDRKQRLLFLYHRKELNQAITNADHGNEGVRRSELIIYSLLQVWDKRAVSLLQTVRNRAYS